MKLIHFSQIDIRHKVSERIAQLENELAKLSDTGTLRICIDAETLFYFEALGYMVDFTTGVVCSEGLSSKDMPF